MNESENQCFAMPREQITQWAAVQGAGAAAPTVPTITPSTTNSLVFMHRSNNWVSRTAGDIARSGAGVYTAKLRDGFPTILDIIPNVVGTDGKRVQVTGYNPVTRVISFSSYNAAGTATDLATTDFCRFTILGQKNFPDY